MQLSPRYDGPPVLQFAGAVTDPSVPLIRQRRRLGELLGTLDDDQWATQSRCEEWKVRDVIAHLIGVDQYWYLSARAALDGAPTRYLEGFDPVTVPASMVAGMQDVSTDELLSSYLEGLEKLGGLLTGLSEEQWAMPAEAPPGHLQLHVVAHHALWDAWVHERDIALPLGLTPDEEPDEIVASLRYAVGLGPCLLATAGPVPVARVYVEGHDPDAHLVVDIGDCVVVGLGDAAPAGGAQLEGSSVELVEALSVRARLPREIADGDLSVLGGLVTVFDPTAR
jgi:uncharacterized protein (TIGR03083 family)